MKSFKIVAIYFFVVIFGSFFLTFLLNESERKNMPFYILMAVGLFSIYFLGTMLRNILSMIDHLLFTNRSVILIGCTVIFNGEILSFDIPLKRELIKKRIRNGNIEIEYEVPARYSDRYSNV